MIATERKGRLARIADLNFASIEENSRRRGLDVAACLDRIESDSRLVTICLLACLCPILVVPVLFSVYVAPPNLAIAKPPLVSTPAILAQEYRAEGARLENLQVLYRRQSSIPGRSAIPGEGLDLMPGTWSRRADALQPLVERYRKLATEQERINQGLPATVLERR